MHGLSVLSGDEVRDAFMKRLAEDSGVLAHYHWFSVQKRSEAFSGGTMSWPLKFGPCVPSGHPAGMDKSYLMLT